ncbi:hypothetical protein B0H10DRAFT_1671003, partial [Mycena sp. CBHHK59/15]
NINVPELSRAGTQGWRQGRNGTRGGAVQRRAATTNWFHPFVFGPIEEEMARTGWSPSQTVKILQRKNPAVYKSLGKGTISRWRVTGENKWTEDTLARISAGKAITASGRTGILTPFPEITENVKQTLQGLRSSGAIVNVSIARGLLIAKITEAKRQLLTKFKVSE